MLELFNSFLENDLLKLINQPERWDSLLINRRKPHTFRVFTQLEDGYRVCLHKFNVCDTYEAFMHPHPWPAAFMILSGKYKMKIGYSTEGREDKQPVDVSTMIMSKYSSYEITNPLTWHSVIPLETTYTVMINSSPWDIDYAHSDVKTTKGKDLEKMSESEVKRHMCLFGDLLTDYLGRYE